MKTMKIYEPAMCCSTGLCGVGVDPELLRISAAIDALKNRGIIIQRYNLSSAPIEFIQNAAVNTDINTNGIVNLPLTLVDDKIVCVKRYPTNEEIAKYLEVSIEFLTAPISGCGCKCGDPSKCHTDGEK